MRKLLEQSPHRRASLDQLLEACGGVKPTPRAVQGGETVKAAKATKHKHISSTPNKYIPVVAVSDQTLASLVHDGTLESNFTVKELKVMLADRHLKVSGNKGELIERLEAYVQGLEQHQNHHQNHHRHDFQAPRPAQQAQREGELQAQLLAQQARLRGQQALREGQEALRQGRQAVREAQQQVHQAQQQIQRQAQQAMREGQRALREGQRAIRQAEEGCIIS